MVEYLIVDRYKRGKSEGIKEGIKEGAKGERSKWQAWYERQQAAQREGRTFDERPPGIGETEEYDTLLIPGKSKGTGLEAVPILIRPAPTSPKTWVKPVTSTRMLHYPRP